MIWTGTTWYRMYWNDCHILGDEVAYIKQEMQDKLIRHKQYIREHGMDIPGIRNWQLE